MSQTVGSIFRTGKLNKLITYPKTRWSSRGGWKLRCSSLNRDTSSAVMPNVNYIEKYNMHTKKMSIISTHAFRLIQTMSNIIYILIEHFLCNMNVTITYRFKES